ncbi:hypothetical protein C2845_PM08G18160 [Panicum miliaceum]|uniref:Uncharacterized protein n=1 Tax=Panicum miliaceum TaxID=4540 RepID=A0A3L6QYD0_PANMI|nr:hypothetical protein C2845_PM08G18160 [Panicum miliaceum]
MRPASKGPTAPRSPQKEGIGQKPNGAAGGSSPPSSRLPSADPRLRLACAAAAIHFRAVVPMVSPSCTPSPVGVLPLPVAGGSTAIHAPFLPLPSRCHPTPNPIHKNKVESVAMAVVMLCAKEVSSIWDAGWEKLGKDGWNKGASYINESGGRKINKNLLLPKKTRLAPPASPHGNAGEGAKFKAVEITNGTSSCKINRSENAIITKE